MDLRAAVVLDPAGDPVVGDGQIAGRAHALLAAGSAPVATDGPLLVARTPDGGALAVLAGDLALRPLLAHDLEQLADGLRTGSADLPETRDSP